MIHKFNISNFPFFYGYVILFSGTMGVLLSAPGQTVGVSVFTDYLIRDLEISRENLSLTYLLGTLLSSFFLTYAGKFYDRFGSQITSILAALFLGLSLLFMSQLPLTITLTTKIISVDRSIHTFFILVIGFFFVRFFGQGTLTMSSKNMIMKWFEKRRGMASAVMGIAISFGFSYSPKIFDDLINLYGWQHAWMLIAFVVGIIFVIFALITFRDDPSKYGLVPDGKEIVRKERGDHKFKPTKDFTLSEARSTFNFWIFNLTLAMQALYITALTFNIVDIFKTAGLTRDDAILIFLPTSIVAVLFQISGGYLADFIKLKYLLMVQLIGMIISMVGLTILAPGLPLYLIIFGNGIAGGLFGVISTVAWPRFYGTKNLGAISGFSMSWVVAGSAIGPYLFSVLYNFNNSYSHVGRLLLVMTGLLLFLSIKIKNQNVLIND